MMTICLLGASGSIGTQTIDVMLKNPADFTLESFSVGHQTRKIRGIVNHFPKIKGICIQDKRKLAYFKKAYPNITFYYGDEGLNELVRNSTAKMVVNALVGFVGLKPTITALECDKIVALSNKESLVVGGELINKLLKERNGKLVPIDSEHVAIAKCLAVQDTDIDKVIITASGGAFRNLKREQLKDVTPEQALNHPNWKMGKKITIDSASMVNKSFEIIEAHYLFDLPVDIIETILNLNSYVHSLVRYNNGTYRMEVGKPDMRKPIKYALYQGLINYETVVSDDLSKVKNTTFAPFDENRYPIVRLAKKVIQEKGTMGAVFNAANEEAVYAFLDHKIPFLGIEGIINQCIEEHRLIKNPSYETLKEVDQLTRAKVKKLIKEGEYKVCKC